MARGIDPKALEILHARQERCMRFPVYLGYDVTTDREGDIRAGIVEPGTPEWHLRCGECGQSVARMMTGGLVFHVTLSQILDNYTRHFIQCHEEVYNGATEDIDRQTEHALAPDTGLHRNRIAGALA